MVNVTKKDLERARDEDCKYCPIELAVLRKMGWGERTPEYCSVFVSKSHIQINSPEYVATYQLPARVQTFIDRFDWGDSVKPIRFEAERSYYSPRDGQSPAVIHV